ncbi:MAG: ribosome-associated translation inhibitor RaiA [Patescibacteria group bacterium]
MNIAIKATNFELTEALQDYATKKVEALKKFLVRFDVDAAQAHIELGKITQHHRKGEIFRAEVNLTIDGRLLRAEETDEDVYIAIDEVHDELKRQIISLKEKRIEKSIRRVKR